MSKIKSYTIEQLLEMGATSFGDNMVLRISAPARYVDEYFKQIYSNVWVYSHQKNYPLN